MTKIRWQSVRENIPGAIKAEDAIVNGRWVELRLMPEGEGFKVEIRFIRDGIKLETWTHSYRVQRSVDLAGRNGLTIGELYRRYQPVKG